MTVVAPLAPNAALRWEVVRRLVARLNPQTILEIGCGQGAYGVRLARRTRYLGLEPDEQSCAVASPRIERVGGEIRNCTFEEFGDTRTFDLVCAFEVLEHLRDDTEALTSWARVIAPRGHVLVSMPAWQDRFNAWDRMVGHYRRYSPEQCRKLMADAGFVQTEVFLYGWPLGFATEYIRKRVAARREGAVATEEASIAERTARSGRVLQPRTVGGFVAELAAAPFAKLQRTRPTSGTGVVVLASPRG